tara:strand:- start:545 stop:1384 length:840 start_codon:yes stop_codon:yes gene_type:complete
LKIFKTKKELRVWRQQCGDQSIGFVPTMGALHQGHLSLIKLAKKNCDKCVVSIFVNQLQFGPQEDFKQYPRTINADIKLLKNEEVDVLFLPSQKEIYPNNMTFEVAETNISKKLEGATRPHFFSGVITIVLKLFNLVQPTYAYFGEKDIQQLYIIKKMVEELNLSIKIEGCSTVREKSGLAMSSRNQYLSTEEQKEAALLYATLKRGAQLIIEKMSVQKIKDQIYTTLNNNKNISIDYISIADLKNFEESDDNKMRPIVISGAVWYKNVRLIDNIMIEN